MGLGTATPCCSCGYGLCEEAGDVTWTDDFGSYQQGLELTPFGYLYGWANGSLIPSHAAPGTSGLMIDGATILFGGSGPGFTAAGRHGPLDLERYTQFDWQCEFIERGTGLNWGLGFQIDETVIPSGGPYVLGSFGAFFLIMNGSGSSAALKVPGKPNQNPLILGSVTQPAMRITVSDYSVSSGQVTWSGSARFWDRAGAFDETITFGPIVTSQVYLCGAVYKAFGQRGSNGYFGTDDWQYSAT